MQNKAKDQKSKLSFYIEVELELFPGTSVNLLQKGVVKCQSTFERIREAWADIRGFEYRPSPMNEAYGYNIKNDEEKKEQRKERKEQHKTQKSINPIIKSIHQSTNQPIRSSRRSQHQSRSLSNQRIVI